MEEGGLDQMEQIGQVILDQGELGEQGEEGEQKERDEGNFMKQMEIKLEGEEGSKGKREVSPLKSLGVD